MQNSKTVSDDLWFWKKIHGDLVKSLKMIIKLWNKVVFIKRI